VKRPDLDRMRKHNRAQVVKDAPTVLTIPPGATPIWDAAGRLVKVLPPR
jgi:hypothetical protein